MWGEVNGENATDLVQRGASAGGHLVSAPSAIVTAVGHDGLASFVVFGEGTNHALYFTTCIASSSTEALRRD
jgi:hypothetical protein